MSQVINDVIKDVQQSIFFEKTLDDSNIYDFINNLNSTTQKNNSVVNRRNTNNGDYSIALKLFLQNFIANNLQSIEYMHAQILQKQINELNLSHTHNERFMVDRNGDYYQLEGHLYKIVPEVINVAENGFYTMKEPIPNRDDYFLLTTYNSEDIPVTLKAVDLKNTALTSLRVCVKILGLKKEFVNKHKRSGYSGNSFDLLANLFNCISKPTETGYYMDKKYNFYRWDTLESCFKIDTRKGLTPGSAILAEYEFKDAKTVLRTDYSGNGLEHLRQLNLANAY